MQVSSPKQDAAKRYYEFTFTNAPVIDCSSATVIPFSVDPALQHTLQGLIQLFLRASAKYFSKQMSEAIFYQRLTHRWGTEQVDVDAGKEVLCASWTPARVLIYPTQYEFHWSLVHVEYVPEPTIPPGFLEREGGLGGELDGVVEGGVASEDFLDVAFDGEEGGKADELPGQPLGALDAEAIPLSSRFTQAERAQRAKERQRIRQARLRLALAQLKAERLAERYYRRYGDFKELSDSDSELSEEEDAANLLRAALADEGDSE
jgi:hypothetical protein